MPVVVRRVPLVLSARPLLLGHRYARQVPILREMRGHVLHAPQDPSVLAEVLVLVHAPPAHTVLLQAARWHFHAL